MAHYRWAGGSSGDFSSGSSWVDETTGLAGAPGPLDSVDLAGSGSITGTGSVATLTADAGSIFNITASLSAGVIEDDGRVFLAGGTLTASALTVASGGQSGQGLLLLAGSGLTTSTVAVGAQSGGSGTLQMAGSQWVDGGAVSIGAAGQGTLLIASSPAGVGIVSIGGPLQLGGSGGSGVLTLTSAVLTTTSQTSLGGATPAQSAGSTLTVQGGSQWHSGGHAILLASCGAGLPANTLSVTGIGTVLQAGLLSIGTGDLASIAGGTIALGTAPGAVGLLVAGTLSVGSGGSLAVNGAGRIVGAAAGMSVTGAAATLTSLAFAAHGHLTLGAGGVLTVGSGVSASMGTITLGSGSLLTANGSATVAALALSSASILSVQGGALHTVGELDLNAGTSLSATNAVLNSAAIGIAPVAAGHTAVSLSGTAQLSNTLWTISGDLLDGTLAAGALSAQASRILVSGNLHLGASGFGGTLAVGPAGIIACGAGLDAAAKGVSAAFIDMEGSASILSAGTLQIGTVAQHAAMTLGGGVAAISGAAMVNGTLTLGGGAALNAGSLVIGGGSAVIGSGSVSAATISDQGRIGVNGGSLTLAGAITGAGLLSIRAGALTITGTEQPGIVFGNAGTLSTPSLADLAGTLSGWQIGDALDFTGIQAASFGFASNKLSLFNSAHHLLGALSFAPGLALHNFTLATDQAGGTEVLFHI